MVAVLATVVVASTALLWCLIRLERAGRRLPVVLLLLGLLLVDSVLYPHPFAVRAGLFHPEIGALSFRLYEVVIALALVARLVVDPPRRFRPPMLLWIAFLVWLMAETLIGLSVGHPIDLLTFEAKAGVYLGALFLTAGVPYEEWRRSRGVISLIGFAAALSTAIIVVSRAHHVLKFDLPGLRGMSFGEMGTDTATLFASLGVIALAIALCRSQRRAILFLAAAPLLLAALVAEQRAAVLGLLASLGVLVIAWVSTTGNRRVTATRREVVVSLLAVAALVAFPAVVKAASGRPVAVPFQDSVRTVVHSRGKEMSAEGRLNQWRKVAPLIRDRPMLGHGLGMTYRYYEPSKYKLVRTNLTHNIVGDLLLRTGVVGALLFLLAIGFVLRGGLRAWRSHVNPDAAAFALGCVAVVTGLLAKGMVESLFEKFRLATLLGLSLGVMLSLAASANAANGTRRNETSAWN